MSNYDNVEKDMKNAGSFTEMIDDARKPLPTFEDCIIKFLKDKDDGVTYDQLKFGAKICMEEALDANHVKVNWKEFEDIVISMVNSNQIISNVEHTNGPILYGIQS